MSQFYNRMAGRLTPELEDIIMHSVDDRGFADVGIDLKQDILRGMERDGVDINTPVQGTPLVAYLASTYANYPTIRFLLEQDKDKAKSAPTRVALLNAVLSGLGQGGDPKELILMLLDEGVDPNAVNAQGFTMFQVALGRGFFVSEAIVAKLIEKGAKVNGTTPGTGIPTLIYAVKGRASPEVIKVLIKNGVDIGAQYKGQTAKQIIEKSPMLKSDYLEILPRLSPELTDLTSFAKSGLIRKFPYGVETEVGKFLTGKTGTLKQQRDKLVGTGRGGRKKTKKNKKRRKTRK
jgi:hypothetical protein